jgi:hypothetical protein
VTTQIRLPSRFPVGTHYIVEGERRKGGQPRIVSRYVLMPSGIRYDLMTPARTGAQARRSGPKEASALLTAARYDCAHVSRFAQSSRRNWLNLEIQKGA